MYCARMRVLMAALVWVVCAALARADGVFDLARKPQESVWLSLDEHAPTRAVRSEPAMLRRVHGVLGQLTKEQVVELMGCADQNGRRGAAPPGARRVCAVHIDGPAGTSSIVIEQGSDGMYVAGVLDETVGEKAKGEQGKWYVLRAERVDRLLGSAAGYLGTFEGVVGEPRPGEVFEVSKPYQAGSVTLDARTIGERIGASGYIRLDPTARVLNKETFHARIPVGFQPKLAAGLVVWMDPSPDGRPPRAMWKALDELGMVCIGAANAGNDRGVTERLQLGLDAVATARRRWNIDASRVYVVGVSGGGKMASILAPCFADVFAGAVPIVGLSTFDRLQAGEGKIWPAEYSKPKGKRWGEASRVRMVAVTGGNDFNHAQILAGVGALTRGGMQVRLCDVAGMGHEFPAPEVLTTQLGWVDEVARETRDRNTKEGRAAMEKAAATKQVADLMDVVGRWPWTEAAWEAAGEIGKKGEAGKGGP